MIVETHIGQAVPLERIPLKDVRGKVDCGIITIREDEFQAVLDRFPTVASAVGEARWYNLSKPRLLDGRTGLVATIRIAEQGGGAAQSAARDFIDDLAPRWLLVVGIAGARPDAEIGLGDVVVSTRVYDLSLEAALPGGVREYSITGGPVDPRAAAIAANIPAFRPALGPWNSSTSIGRERPAITFEPFRFEGSPDWQKKVEASVRASAARSEPIASAFAVACSDRLLRDTEIIGAWLKLARHLFAIEMESHGVFRAANSRVPFLAIRGISDIVGFRRDGAWTSYACHTAAAFTRALVGAGVFHDPPPVMKQPSASSTATAQPPTPQGTPPLQFDKEAESRLCDALASPLGLTRRQALSDIGTLVKRGAQLTRRLEDVLCLQAGIGPRPRDDLMLVLVEGGITLSLKAVLGEYSSLSSRPDPVEDRFSADCLDVLRSAQAWHLNESVLSLMLGQRTSIAASCKVIGGSLAASVCKFLVEATNQDGWPLLVQRLPTGEQLAHGSLWHDHSMLLELLQTLHLEILIRGRLPQAQLAHILEFASACEGNPGIFIGKTASGLASLIRTGEQDPDGWQR